MHGIIFSELKAFAESIGGEPAWRAICEKAGQPGKLYASFGAYPDEELTSLVVAASEVTGVDADALLVDFGTFVAPHLVALYKHRIPAAWGALDLLEHTEGTIHEIVRARDPDAAPPRLVATRKGSDSVVIEYSSERKLCQVAKGIIRGLGDHYSQPLEVSETSCMHDGDPSCVLVVRVASPGS